MVKQGDVIKINFNPNKGHEQAGYRPALVVSNNIYNNQTKMAIVCPITNTTKGFPLHIELDDRTETSGAILCEHVRAMDIYEKGYKYIEKLPEDLLRRVAEIIGFEIEVI
jgi:toxin-antitoxin system, toxin component, mazF family